MRTLILLSLILVGLFKISAETNKQKLIWGIQFGSSNEEKLHDIALDDSGNVYVSGYTKGNIANTNAGGKDGFICKYSNAGELKWKFQIGTTTDDEVFSLVLDNAHNLYVVGNTGDSLGEGGHAGGYDCFVAKLTTKGELIWINQFGSAGDEYGQSIILDSENNIFVCGYTTGQLGDQHFGGGDPFIIKLDDRGIMQWTNQYGTNKDEYCSSIIEDNNGNLLITGSTLGIWSETNPKDTDQYVIQIDKDGELLIIVLGDRGLLWISRPYYL